MIFHLRKGTVRKVVKLRIAFRRLLGGLHGIQAHVPEI